MWKFILKTVILLSCGFTQAAILSKNKPIPWSLPESVTGISKLSIDCSGRLYKVSTSPSHCSHCFGVIPAGTGTYSLFYAARNGASLDYDTVNLYTFSMSCDDGTTDPTTGDVILHVIPNFPPSFQDTSSIMTVSSATTAGGQVYDPKPQDEENDQLTFSLEESPNNGFFQIDANGVVRAKKSLNTFCSQETLMITMEDGSNPPVNKTITMDPGGNTKPTLRDWNRVMTIPENTVLELPITDNLGTDGSCILTVNPPEYSAYFDSTSRCPQGAASRIITPAGGETFNFEVHPPVNISLVLDNGNCPADAIWVYLKWTDVPDPPTLTLNRMDFLTKEGLIEIEPEYEIKDDDNLDKHVYSFVDPDKSNPNFKIDPDTGRIYTPKYYEMNCDKDKDGFIFEVQVTDQNGNVSEPPVKVKLNLTDVNDHRPRFTRRFDITPSVYADCIQPFILVDLSDDVTDDDCEITNRAVEFVEISSGSLSISKYGIVRITKPPIAGRVDILTILAIDKGEPPLLSETETISILGYPCPTTPRPVVYEPDHTHNNNNNGNNNNIDNNNNNNDNYNNGNNNNNGVTSIVATVAPVAPVATCFFDYPGNVASIVLAAILGLLLLPLLLYLCCRFCGNACYNCRNPPLKTNKIKPNKLSGDGKGKAEKKKPEEGMAEEGEVVTSKKSALVENGYSNAEAGGSGGGGYSSENGGGEGVVVGDAEGGKTNDG
ncbi:hypothetical protein LOTGIDRAFT_171826 [Lottia gigantea]|uniref:Cadherin domain-containing protein n=1 Tax=Lottia gigantea TaxID=225164 RepID=V4CK67_LOTGI|nr:hypothetical protein LOTGIDRAFT_171826 [Lottia gigantea]ESP02625.1 hypothetical protein LOTGIDRAFT_171826 [Lottia gigantea]